MNKYLKLSLYLIWMPLALHHNFVSSNSKELIAQIKAVIKKSDCHTGVAIYSFKNDEYLYTKNFNKPFMPASNTKLFTGLAALEILGKEYRFETPLLTDGSLHNHTLQGNVYIQGSGDPSFTSQNFESLIAELAAKGIQKIEGDFCIDREIFDTQAFAPGTAIDNVGESWFNPIGGLIIDHKAVAIQEVPFVEFLNNNSDKIIYFDGVSCIKNALQKHAITLSGTIIFKKTPEKSSLIATHASAPITVLINKFMKQSDNLYADCFLKKLGAHVYKTTGTWKNGVDALKGFLTTTLGTPSETIRFADGSGLSRYNLVSPAQIATTLIWAYQHPKFNRFLKTLPISGVDGTLVKRMTTDLASKVKAKTGTLGAVSALSGYLTTEDDTLAFVILNNNYISESIFAPACKREIEDALCQLLVEWKSC